MVLTRRYIPLCVGIVFLLSVGLAWGATPPATPAADTLQVNYFSGANTEGYPDGTVQLDNPGASGGNVCAMIYVFDPDEEMSECCGCTLTPDDLRTLSVNVDLTSNPLRGHAGILTTGLIKIVASKPGSGGCNPEVLAPEPNTRDWGTHIITTGDGTWVATETIFQNATLSSAEVSALEAGCTAIAGVGSGAGVCTCGTGS